MSGLGYVAPEEDRRCELCGKVAECRPYGPNGEQVCFACGMKDEEGTIIRAMNKLYGERNA